MAVTPDNLDLGRGGTGLNEETIREMSWRRDEPDWMLDRRLAALRHLDRSDQADRRGDLAAVLPAGIDHHAEPTEDQADEWRDLLDAIEHAQQSPGDPTAGRRPPVDPVGHGESEAALQFDRQRLERQGVVFCDLQTAVMDHPELVSPHLATIIPADGDRRSALNTSLWSTGSFIYVPPGVEIDVPLQASLRTAPGTFGRFERTLLVADEGSKVHYIDGCSAPVYTSDPLHSAVVEIVVRPSATVGYTTIQNWSSNVFNLVTMRARVEADGHLDWIDGNFGSRLTSQHLATWLVGPRGSARALSVAYAGHGQHQHTGSTMVHAAPETSSTIVSRSISKDGGRSSHGGRVRVTGNATGCTGQVHCDGLLLDDASICEPYPSTEIEAVDAEVDQEAAVSTVADEHLFYLMSRGLSRQQALGLVVNGFIEPVTRTLPIEYAVEWSRLVELQIEGSVG